MDDIPEAIDPATNQLIATADDPQKTGNKTITVWDIVQPVTGRKVYYNTANPGVCPVFLQATTEVNWSVQGMPGVTTAFLGAADPNNPAFFQTGSAQFRGLPPGPTDFGMKRVTASRGGRTRETYVYVFYPHDATNHPVVMGDPPVAAGWPNWYYYWRQTSASSGSHSYDAGLPYPGIVRWESLAGAWQTFIGPSCYRAQGNPSAVIGWGLPWESIISPGSADMRSSIWGI